MSDVKIKLNGKGISSFFKNSKGLAASLKKTANSQKKEIQQATNQSEKQFAQLFPFYTPQKKNVTVEKGETTDRQTIYISITPITPADFAFNPFFRGR